MTSHITAVFSKSLVCLSTLIAYFSADVHSVAQDKPVIVCSTTQVADFARQIVGERCEVICLLGEGQDPHTYQISVNDAREVSRADLCLQNGWHLEGHQWMEKLAKDAGVKCVSCVDGIKAIELEDEATRFDPHAWFTPRNAATYVRNILKAVNELKPEHKEEFSARAALYLAQLEALDRWIRLQVGSIPANRRVLVTHHDAFGYFCQEYNIKPMSLVGWSTEEIGEISIDDYKANIDTIRKSGVKAIFVETTLNPQAIERLAKDAGVEIGGELYSDAMGKPGSLGATYIGMMRENVLKIVSGLK